MDLVFPSNAVLLGHEEMCDIGGGFDAAILGKNLYGLAKKSAAIYTIVNTVSRTLGKTSPYALQYLNAGKGLLVRNVGGSIMNIANTMGGPVFSGIVGLGAAFVVNYLGTYRKFY